MATTDSRKARELLGFLLAFGLFLGILGAALIFVNWPEMLTETDPITGETTTTQDGNQAFWAGGLVLAGVGQLMATVGLMGYAVSLGVRVAQGHVTR